MKVGDTVKVKDSGEVGIVVGDPTGDHFKTKRWIVQLAYTMDTHIFQEKDIEII